MHSAEPDQVLALLSAVSQVRLGGGAGGRKANVWLFVFDFEPGAGYEGSYVSQLPCKTRAPAQVASNPAAMFDQRLLSGDSGGVSRSGEASVSFTQRYAQSLGVNAGGFGCEANPVPMHWKWVTLERVLTLGYTGHRCMNTAQC